MIREFVESLRRRFWKLKSEHDKLKQAHEALLFEHQEQGFCLSDALDNLNRINPIYERLYREPLFWLERPHDGELTGEVLFECRCGKQFWKDSQEEFTTHKGHHYSPAKKISDAEWEKIMAEREQVFFEAVEQHKNREKS
jgi:hypothetical protein